MKKINKYYIDDDELYYEIILSKGKGFLTNKAIDMLCLIGTRVIRRMKYFNPTDKEDCFQTGIEIMFKNWRNFNEKKYTKALPYFSELFKRGTTLSLRQLHDKRMFNNLDYIQNTYYK